LNEPNKAIGALLASWRQGRNAKSQRNQALALYELGRAIHKVMPDDEFGAHLRTAASIVGRRAGMDWGEKLNGLAETLEKQGQADSLLETVFGALDQLLEQQKIPSSEAEGQAPVPA